MNLRRLILICKLLYLIHFGLIGILKLLDDAEKDDKLIIIHDSSPLNSVRNINDLISNFPGILTIIEIWFENYKGLGAIKTNGYMDRKSALTILESSMMSFKKSKSN